MMAKEIMYQAAKDPKLLHMKPKVRWKQVAKKSFFIQKINSRDKEDEKLRMSLKVNI